MNVLFFAKLTHKKLERYVVHEDMIQRDDAQLPKIRCKFHSIDVLQNQDGQVK